MDNEPKLNDHDLLIQLHVEVKGIRSDIKEMKNTISDSKDDHEKRIRVLENWRFWMLGGLGVVSFAIIILATIKK